MKDRGDICVPFQSSFFSLFFCHRLMFQIINFNIRLIIIKKHLANYLIFNWKTCLALSENVRNYMPICQTACCEHLKPKSNSLSVHSVLANGFSLITTKRSYVSPVWLNGFWGLNSAVHYALIKTDSIKDDKILDVYPFKNRCTYC